MSEKKLLKSIKESGSELVLENKMLHGNIREKMFFFISKNNDFSFPLKQVSSIKYQKDRDIKWKKLIFGIFLSLVGLGFISSYGWLLLILGLPVIYIAVKSDNIVRITTSGGDGVSFSVSSNNIKDANEFVSLANETIANI